VFRAASFARYLPQFGIDVVVLSATEPLQGLQHYPQQANLEGTEVVRVPFDEDARSPWGKKVESFALRFPLLSGTTKNRQLERRAKSIWLRARAVRDFSDIDAVFATSPPPVTLLLGSYIARQLRVPLWCDLRDPWTYGPGAKYRTTFDLWIESGVERRVLQKAKAVIANTDAARQELLADFGLRAEDVKVVPNGFDENGCRVLEHEVSQRASHRRFFDVVYVGLGPYHPEMPSARGGLKRRLGLDIAPVEVDNNTRSPLYILRALQEACARDPRLRDTLRLRWVGPINDHTRQLFRAYDGCFQIDAPGGVSEDDSIRAIFTADLLVLLQIELFRDGRDYSTVVPAKLFTYLRSGKPILAAVQPGELANLTSTFSGCATVLPRDVTKMADHVLMRFQEWTSGSSPHYERREALHMYERSNLARRVADLVRAG
jgi:glycosyltransferase involved in cell wall biosynthesis